MLNLTGRLINVFKQQGGTNKKGETFEDRDKIQILGGLDLPNGEVKHELVTLTVDDTRPFIDLINEDISVPVGVMSLGRNVIYYVAKGAKPVLAGSL
jgi:hypothetical protein